MTDRQTQGPDLKRLAATEVLGLIDGVSVGEPLPVTSGTQVCDAELCNVLEYLIPELLAVEHPEWRGESLDGFYFSHAVLDRADAVELAGTCILITDQRVTPLVLNLAVSPDETFDRIRVRLGEPGGGSLKISGPLCTSTAAGTLLLELDHRLDRVDWVYDVVVQ